MKTLKLSRGMETVVDDDVYDWAAQHWWTAGPVTGKFYAHRKVVTGGKRIHVSLHRFIVGAKPGEYVDHINGDTLDNRRCNLRVCTHAQNLQNRVKKTIGTSKYKGVSWNKRDKRWYANITKSDGLHFLGAFIIEEMAAKAYDKAALESFGEFACINFPPCQAQ